MQLHGLKYISTPRLHQRGGGANLSKFSLEKLDVIINDKLEIVWGLLRPKMPSVTPIREIIVVAFYCPPRSRKKTKLMDHLVSNCHALLTKYPNAGLIIGGIKMTGKLPP